MAAISAQEFDEVTVNGEACFERGDRGGAGMDRARKEKSGCKRPSE